MKQNATKKLPPSPKTGEVKNKKTVFLVAAKEISESVLELYSSIRRTIRNSDKIFLLYHISTPTILKVENMNIHSFTGCILNDLGYQPIADSLIPGSNHFALLDFYSKHRDFEFYWYIEDDVVFNGNWRTFLEVMERYDQDFVSSHIDSYHAEPEWPWWKTLKHPVIQLQPAEMIKSFNPVYRISKLALQCIHDSLLNQWEGHHEVLLPTLLEKNNFRLLDFGNGGPYTALGLKNTFYTENTFRWRPVFTKVGTSENMFYHPIKNTERTEHLPSVYVHFISQEISQILYLQPAGTFTMLFLKRQKYLIPQNETIGAIFHYVKEGTWHQLANNLLDFECDGKQYELTAYNEVNLFNKNCRKRFLLVTNTSLKKELIGYLLLKFSNRYSLNKGRSSSCSDKKR